MKPRRTGTAILLAAILSAILHSCIFLIDFRDIGLVVYGVAMEVSCLNQDMPFASIVAKLWHYRKACMIRFLSVFIQDMCCVPLKHHDLLLFPTSSVAKISLFVVANNQGYRKIPQPSESCPLYHWLGIICHESAVAMKVSQSRMIRVAE